MGGIFRPNLYDVHLSMDVQRVWTLPTALRQDRERPRSSRLGRVERNGHEIHTRGSDWECFVRSEEVVSSPSDAGFGTRSEKRG